VCEIDGFTSISIPEDDYIRIRLVIEDLGVMLHGSGSRPHAPPRRGLQKVSMWVFGKTRIANLGVSCGSDDDDCNLPRGSEFSQKLMRWSYSGEGHVSRFCLVEADAMVV
jgi:hypothetical protein